MAEANASQLAWPAHLYQFLRTGRAKTIVNQSYIERRFDWDYHSISDKTEIKLIGRNENLTEFFFRARIARDRPQGRTTARKSTNPPPAPSEDEDVDARRCTTTIIPLHPTMHRLENSLVELIAIY